MFLYQFALKYSYLTISYSEIYVIINETKVKIVEVIFLSLLAWEKHLQITPQKRQQWTVTDMEQALNKRKGKKLLKFKFMNPILIGQT